MICLMVLKRQCLASPICNMEFFTAGVYNSDENSFFAKLAQNGIDTFLDIRQRRAVRGAKYSFVNSNALQRKLHSIGISYLYVKELSPTAEIRQVQKDSDLASNVLKRNRSTLSDQFVSKYKSDIVHVFDFDQLFSTLADLGSKNIVLFCVEEKSDACHRSLVAEHLSVVYGHFVKHL